MLDAIHFKLHLFIENSIEVIVFEIFWETEISKKHTQKQNLTWGKV